jgi:hypothetical protein
MIELLIFAILLIACLAIVFWALNSMGGNLPEPIRIAVIAGVAIVALLLVAGFARRAGYW